MQVDDLDFEEVSLLRERSEALKKEYRSYLVAHPELTQLLSDLVNSCLVHKPGDVFGHAAGHFGLGVVASAASELAELLDKFEQFKALLEQEAAGSALSEVIKFVFWEYDADNNGTLETDEWYEFLTSFDGLGYEETQATKLHEFICGETDASMTPQQLQKALDWLSDKAGTFEPLAPGATDAAAISSVVANPMAAAAEPAAQGHRVIFCGPPASGKGLQCEMIIKKYGVKHVSTGTLLQAAIGAGTELGLKAKEYIDQGEMVPETLTGDLVVEGMKGLEGGWLLDGFPRTQAQAQALNDAGVIPSTLLVLDVPDAVLVEKSVQRRLDPETGKMYHLTTDPPPEDIKERLVQRPDDAEEVVKSRLQQYNETKDAVCSVFVNMVRKVDGNRGDDVVSAAIVKVLETGADAEMDASAAQIQAIFRGKNARASVAKPESGPQDFATEMEKWVAFKGALVIEAKAGGYQLPVLLKHVFWSFDSDNNGLLDKSEFLNFLNDVGKPHGLVFSQAESDSFHKYICDSDDSDMSQEQLEAAMLKIVASGDSTGETNTKFKIIISGAPASGKGGQCEMLVAKYGIKHVSTGDLLRAAVLAGSEDGLKAKGFMDDGKLVPDDVLVSVVAACLSGETQGWLLDGFPRSKVQAQALRDAGVAPDIMLVLDVPDAVLMEKSVQRRLDPETGKMYHLTTDPPPEDIKERLVQRSDDAEEKIQARLQQYNETKDGVCSVFSDVVSNVNADRDEGSLHAAIVSVLESGEQEETAAENDPVLGVCVIGAPASGKGALSQSIAAAQDLKQILFGDLIRAAIASDSDIGKEAKACIDKDEDVHDTVLVQLAKDAISTAGSGWLMDGFPRSVAQAKAMQDGGFAPSVVLLVDVAEERLVERCTNRRIDPETGTVYDIKTNAPDSEEVTARLIQRLDDTEDRVKERLSIFHAQKDEVCTAFADVVQVVDGSKDPEAMLADATAIIESTSLTD